MSIQQMNVNTFLPYALFVLPKKTAMQWALFCVRWKFDVYIVCGPSWHNWLLEDLCFLRGFLEFLWTLDHPQWRTLEVDLLLVAESIRFYFWSENVLFLFHLVGPLGVSTRFKSARGHRIPWKPTVLNVNFDMLGIGLSIFPYIHFLIY